MQDISYKKSVFVFCAILIAAELLLYQDFIFGNLYFIAKDMGSDGYLQVYPFAKVRMDAYNVGEAPQWMFYNGLGENLYPFSFELVFYTVWSTMFKTNLAGGFIFIQLIHTFFFRIAYFFIFQKC